MKLLTKTSLVYLLGTSLVFLAGGLVFYHNLRSIMDEETTEKLLVQKTLFKSYIQKHNALPGTSYDADETDFVREVSQPVQEHFSDTSYFSHEEGETLPYRTLLFPVKLKEKNYAVKISKPLFESDDLVETILLSFSIVAAVLLVVILLLNRLVSKKLWKPFFDTVRQLNSYEISRHETLQPVITSTSEFRELNDALEKMTGKISADYLALKSFTENASHELQTPLSVILNSTELLLQKEQLDQQQVEAVQRVHQAAKKLSRLNQTLLLLAKIGNQQFYEKRETLDVTGLIESKADFFAELLAHKNLTLRREFKSPMTIRIHPALAEIMVSNLFSNAIRHSKKDSYIRITIDQGKFEFANPGKPLLQPERIFDRFYKENPSSESTGLGLSLVRQIAESNKLQLSYRYENGEHCFTVRL